MTERLIQLAGGGGIIDIAIDSPSDTCVGKALILHPHPLFAGTRDNKVVQTIARSLVALGYECWRPNFRGVGDSQGSYDNGIGETQDMLLVLEAMNSQTSAPQASLVLAGFSFGGFVASRVAQAMADQLKPFGRLILVAPAVGRFQVEPVRSDTLVIHGEQDDVVSLADAFDWARPQNLPLVVIPGADHFFHRRLTVIKNLIFQAWGRYDLCVPVGVIGASHAISSRTGTG